MRFNRINTGAAPGRITILALCGSLWFVQWADAQPPPGSGLPVPRLFTITPGGGKAGTTFDVTFSGADIEEPQALMFSQPGIKAVPVIPPAPAVDPKNPAAKPAPRPPVTQFKVTIAADTPLGIHDVRLV